MTEDHINTIRACRPKLVNRMTPDPVLDHLALTISLQEMETIKAEKVRYRKVDTFLDVLIRKSDDAYHTFLDSLDGTKQGFLAEMLRKHDTSQPMGR